MYLEKELAEPTSRTCREKSGYAQSWKDYEPSVAVVELVMSVSDGAMVEHVACTGMKS